VAPIRPRGPRRVLAVPVVMALVVGACGGARSSPEVTASATIEATATSVATAAPTLSPEPTAASPGGAAPTASADANTFVSPHYDYALTLPPGTVLLAWHAADRPWDGVNSVNEDSLYVDRSSVAEGGLYILGSPADDLDEFFTRFESNGPRAHACDAAKDRVDVAINGVPAIGFTQVCGEGYGRLVVFKDGFGIGASIHTLADKVVPARDRLIELFAGLEWRPG
jgi:hypothetical protein